MPDETPDSVISDYCYIPAQEEPETDGILRVLTWDGSPTFMVKIIKVEVYPIRHSAIARPQFCDYSEIHLAVVVTGKVIDEDSPIVVMFTPDFDPCGRYWYALAGDLIDVRNAAHIAAPNVG